MIRKIGSWFSVEVTHPDHENTNCIECTKKGVSGKDEVSVYVNYYSGNNRGQELETLAQIVSAGLRFLYEMKAVGHAEVGPRYSSMGEDPFGEESMRTLSPLDQVQYQLDSYVEYKESQRAAAKYEAEQQEIAKRLANESGMLVTVPLPTEQDVLDYGI